MQNVPDIPHAVPHKIEEYRGRKDPAAMKAVAKEMEAMFAYEMIKVMRETSDVSSKGGLGMDTYMSLFDQEISKLVAERGLGLQNMLEKGLKHAAGKSGAVPNAPDVQQITKEEKPANADEIKTLLPDVHNARISSGYGLRHDPYSGEMKNHYGLDIPAAVGTDIHAIRNGTVVFSGEQKGYGNVVVIDHGDGFMTKYAHNQINLVQQGQKVDTGTVIAQVGSTGRSTGPHVHFEVLYKGEHVNPDTLLALK
jgi:murein DD-endopeptidase MepM/ murein hydrolase activator NlpD